jgi:hydrogenase maturation protein HypF
MTFIITVTGIVQGVGFRPFVARLAKELNITGTVMNSGGIVKIIAEGSNGAIDSFVHRLKFNQPSGADVGKIIVERVADVLFKDFSIISSDQNDDGIPLIPSDLPICDSCKSELYDSRNRRYYYPFISCVACGPRYSIIDSLPYDRNSITMREFTMCDECDHEYHELDNRRLHAQTISCHYCGPQLILMTSNSTCHNNEALDKSIEILRSGRILAVKGTGGYQFACLPTSKNAVNNLRALKNRDMKPFAVMFPSLDVIKKFCYINNEEESLLKSPATPIVLLKQKNKSFCRGVNAESQYLGGFLAYTPLHQLLTDACGPLIMTSGNIASNPIIIDDDEMLQMSSPYLEGVLYNKRKINTNLDDSVCRVICGKAQIIRRSRGYVPLSIDLQQESKRSVLAMGGDVKSCFCLYSFNRAYLSQYFGDMENYNVSRIYQKNLQRMSKMFGIHPEVIACDLHPHYITTHLAEKTAKSQNIKLIKIQHHHAHAATVMAEYNLSSCIGVVFDGTGYGTDGKIWGGEFLLCKANEYERLGHLGYITICGGDSASRNAELTACSYIYAADETVQEADITKSSYYELVKSAIVNKVNIQESSSMGRLFDAVSAILNIKKENTFEGECAIALEKSADIFLEGGGAPYPMEFRIDYGDKETLVDQVGLIKTVITGMNKGFSPEALALGFHKAIARMILNVCSHIRSSSGENRIALSGGVFANRILTEDSVALLTNAGFEVFINSVVPTNDSGICLGQAWLCKDY